MWVFDRKPIFKKQYKQLGSERQIRVKDALRELVQAEDPTKLGVYKASLGVFAYELSRGDRILYNVKRDDNVIELIRVGGHKEVYGKD